MLFLSDGSLAIVLTLVTSVVFVAVAYLYSARRRQSVDDYVVARGSVGGMLATATLVASAMGAWILFSPAETGTWAGLVGLIGYSLGSAAPIAAFVILGARMRRLMPEGRSLTDFVWTRYGPMTYLASVAVIVFYMFIFLAAEMTGIALAARLIGDTPLWVTALIVGAMTVAYTAYGGLRASVITDGVQFMLIIPLLGAVLIALLFLLDGFGPAISSVGEQAGHLLSLGHGPGIEFAFTLFIAVWAANMFHQGFWQRVYTVRDERSLRRGFAAAAAVVIPMVMLAGLLGIVAVGHGSADEPSVALFSLVLDVMPRWAWAVVLVAGLMLVMSSMDTLLNGIASAVTSDLARFRPSWSGSRLLGSSRLITLAVVVPAIAIASQGYSVLYLFLIADLICAAAVVPVFYGLYNRRLSDGAVAAAFVAGVVVGVLFFPASDFSAWNSIPWSGKTLVSFATALGASTVVALVGAHLLGSPRKESEFDFGLLAARVRAITD